MKGVYNQILKIDLSQRSHQVVTLGEDVYQQCLGGKGLAAYLLTQYNPVGVDPLAPENCLIFATGPLGGSTIWGSCRYGVFTKSPLTGIFAESYCGGRTPDTIDAAGFDAILMQGACDRPTVLTVHPEGVVFHDAGDIWGMDTYAAEDALRARFKHPDYRKNGAVVIGPAGENGVRFAVIENDYWRSAGRTGVGTVMGSKKIKGIVFSGDRKRPHADDTAVKQFSKKFMTEYKNHAAADAYRSLGTPMLVKLANQASAFPTRYWTAGSYKKWEKISADAVLEQMEPKPHGCGKCFMHCGKLGTVKTGPHKGLKIEGPEYETIYAFGGLCLIDDINEIAYLNDVCDRLGMDTITAGNLCGLAIEAARRGRIDSDLDYGDTRGIGALLHAIAAKKGVGAVLAEGIRFAAKEWQLEDIAVHVKGMEPAGYDPRGLKGMGLAYATSDRGACHLRATFYKPELSGMISHEQIEGKAEMFLEFEDRLSIMDTLVLCRFYRDFYMWDVLADIISRVTGVAEDKKTLRDKARAIAASIRRFNLREGMTAADDTLPPALHRAQTDSGKVITENELSIMLKEYYDLHGWDENGVPM